MSPSRLLPFITPVSSWACKNRRRILYPWIFAWILGGSILFSGYAVAQTTAASHFGNVSGWKGMVSVSGSGSGTFHPLNCTDNYSNNQTIGLAPELEGSFPQWGGPSFPSQVSLVISNTSTCPNGIGGTNVCLTTITGMGGVAPVDEFLINIDAQNGTYTLTDAGHETNVFVNSCTGSMTQLYPWGPISGPSGGAIPLITASYPLPAHGVHLQMTIPPFDDAAGVYIVPWNISWSFSPVCKVSTNNLGQGTSGQGAMPWGSNHYDHDPADGTISQWGCALTCLSMALNNAGLTQLPSETTTTPNNPGTLNTLMTNSDTDYGQATSEENGTALNFGVIDWDAAVRDAQCGGPCPAGSSPNLHWNNFGGRIDSRTNPEAAMNALDEVLCGANPHPVIVGVKSTDPNRNAFPGHFVLVTGREADDTYDIVDPAGRATSLNAPPYNGVFVTAGYISDPTGDIHGLDLFLNNNATILVTDPNGLQTGLSSSSGNTLQMIPQSAYFEDALDNDVTGAQATNVGHLVMIFQPVSGRYVAVINGFSPGPYQLSIRAFSQDGSSQSPILVQGAVEQGSTFTYIVNYLSTPGSTSTVTPMAGDRNGDGVVNCADLDIVKASFGKSIGQPGFDPRADVNADGVVNILDLAAVAKQLPTGTTCP